MGTSTNVGFFFPFPHCGRCFSSESYAGRIFVTRIVMNLSRLHPLRTVWDTGSLSLLSLKFTSKPRARSWYWRTNHTKSTHFFVIFFHSLCFFFQGQCFCGFLESSRMKISSKMTKRTGPAARRRLVFFFGTVELQGLRFQFWNIMSSL